MSEKHFFPIPEEMDFDDVQTAHRYYPEGFLEQLSDHYRRSVTLGMLEFPQTLDNGLVNSSLITHDFSFPVQLLDIAKKSGLRTLGVYRVISYHIAAWTYCFEGKSLPRSQCDIVLFSYRGKHPIIGGETQIEATLWNNNQWSFDEHTKIVFPGIQGQPRPILLEERIDETNERQESTLVMA